MCTLRSMRYPDAIANLHAFIKTARECSREWTITRDLVMSVELDLSALAAPVVTARHSARQRTVAGQMLVVTFHRFYGTGVYSWPDALECTRLSSAEKELVESRRRDLHAWSSNEIDDLPPSTTTRVADLRSGRCTG